MTSKWTDVDEDSSVLLEYPCDWGVWCARFDVLGKPEKHCHIRISCDDGTGTIPAQIESREFLAFLLAHLNERGTLTTSEWSTINNLPETIHLIEKATDRERKVMEDPELLKKWTTFGYASTW